LACRLLGHCATENENAKRLEFHGARGSFVFDRRDHNFVALRARGIEHEKKEAAIASDDAEFGASIRSTLHNYMLDLVSKLRAFRLRTQ
jgi:hypothetical protein